MLKCLKFQQAFFCCPEKSGIVKGRGKRRKWDESKLDSQALGILWIPLPHFRLCPAKLKCRNHAHMLSCTQSQKSFECGHTQTHLNATRVCSCVWAPPFFFEMSCIYTLSLSLRLYAFLRLLFALVRNLICVFVLRFSFGCRPKKRKILHPPLL